MKVADMSFVRLRPDHPLAARLQDVILWDVPLAQWYAAFVCLPRTPCPFSPRRLGWGATQDSDD